MFIFFFADQLLEYTRKLLRMLIMPSFSIFLKTFDDYKLFALFGQQINASLLLLRQFFLATECVGSKRIFSRSTAVKVKFAPTSDLLSKCEDIILQEQKLTFTQENS